MQNGLIEYLINISRLGKRGIVMGVDCLLCLITVATAYYLRIGEWVLPMHGQWFSYICAIMFSLPLFVSFGLYRAIFRYAGWGALIAVLRVITLYGLIYATLFTVVGVKDVPRTVGLIQPILLLIAIGGTRMIGRYLLGKGYREFLRVKETRRVLIYGAGSAGRQLAAGLANSHEMRVVGFVDDDANLHGRVLNGKLIHASDNLDALIKKLDIADLLLAIPSTSRHRRNEILEKVRRTSAVVRTIPGLADIAHGRVTINDLRELDIEDLLGRDLVPPNPELLGKTITGKIVLVTGAGGSIGSELCRQIVAQSPSALILVEQSEFNLYTIHQELEQWPVMANDENGIGPAQLVPLLASVQDAGRMERIVATWKPDTIYHAAAYKHVPLVELNPAEGVCNNVFGTLTVAQIAQKHEVSDFVLISTDKAVRPTNIMGATKRVTEQILQALAANKPATRFSMVRFGNVLGSSGSVVPLFRRQIKAGGPITITHEDITRYFMTIPEAAQLVIQAGAMAEGGEVFVLDMGEPVKIMALARRMIELSGLSLRDATNLNGDIAIEVIGLRPGEKLYEELLIGDDPQPTRHSRIMKARDGHLTWSEMTAAIAELQSAVTDGNTPQIQSILAYIVPELTFTRHVAEHNLSGSESVTEDASKAVAMT